jgi:hypothetical protein
MLREIVMDNLDQPLVVAGDFNAVDDHGPMQALQRLGLEERDRCGRSWLASYLSRRWAVATATSHRSRNDQQRADGNVGHQLRDLRN